MYLSPMLPNTIKLSALKKFVSIQLLQMEEEHYTGNMPPTLTVWGRENV